MNVYSFHAIRVSSFILYKISLDLFCSSVLPKLGYYAIAEVNLNAAKLVESFFLLLTILTLMPWSWKMPSNTTLWLLIVLSYIPMLTLYAFQNQPRAFMYAATGFWLGVAYVLRVTPSLRVPIIKKQQAELILGCIFPSFIVYLIWIMRSYGALNILFTFDLSQLYNVRYSFVESVPRMWRYPFYWMATGVVPVFFAASAVRKKWLLAGCILILEFFLALTVGQRTYVFIPLYALGLIWAATGANPVLRAVLSLSVLVIVSIIVSHYLTGLGGIIARWLLVPAQLNFHYYNFFRINSPIPFVYLFEYYFGFPLLNDPYGLSPDLLIGEFAYGSPGLAAVAGIIGDAYMNLRFIGLAIWSLALAIFLKLMDGFSKGVDQRITMVVAGVSALVITNTYLIRAVITSGTLLSVLILYLLRGAGRSKP
jgi:hypothetical protein